MAVSIDFSEFRELNNFNDKQPLFPFVEITIGETTVSDFSDELGDTVMDLLYRRTAHRDEADVAGDTFTVTLYDDTAIEIESLIYNVILRTTHQAEENISDEESSSDSQPVYDDTHKDEDEDNTGDSEDIDTDNENIDIDDGTGKSSDEMWAEALEQINNIDITYGWVDMNGNRFLDRSIQGNYTKYSMEFEGASAILTIEGTSVASTGLNSPSSVTTKEFSSDKFGGVPSKIVKNIVDSVSGLSYTSDSIEETEAILGEDGKPKSFVMSGETYEQFIVNNLCEEAKSKKSGRVGYKFYTDNKIAYFLPSDSPDDVKVEIQTSIEANKNYTLRGMSTSLRNEYDDGSYSIETGGTEFTDDLDDYDEEDEYDDEIFDDDTLTEEDLVEDIGDYTGITSVDPTLITEPTDEEIEQMNMDLESFKSEEYEDLEHEEDRDIEDADESIDDEDTDTEDTDNEDTDIDDEEYDLEDLLGEEKPEWLRKFGIKLELWEP